MVEGEDRSGKRAHTMQRLVTLRGSDLPTNLQKREIEILATLGASRTKKFKVKSSLAACRVLIPKRMIKKSR